MSDSQGLIDRRKLRAKRIRAGLTAAALGRRAGLHETTPAAIERGARGISPETLCALAAALGCDIDDLMPDEQVAA